MAKNLNIDFFSGRKGPDQISSCIIGTPLIKAAGLYCTTNPYGAFTQLVGYMLGGMKGGMLDNMLARWGMDVIRDNKKVLSEVTGAFAGHLIEVPNPTFKTVSNETVEWFTTLAAPVASNAGTGAQTENWTFSGPLLPCANMWLTYENTSTGAVESVYVQSFDTATNTGVVIRNLTEKPQTMGAIPAGSDLRILRGSMSTSQCEATTCCAPLPKECCEDWGVQRNTYCETMPKDTLVQLLDCRLEEAGVSTEDYIKNLSHEHLMEMIGRTFENSLYFSRKAKFVDSNNPDGDVYVGMGLVEAMEDATPEYVDTCCINRLLDVISRAARRTPRSSFGFFKETDILVAFAGRGALNHLAQLVESKRIIQEDIREYDSTYAKQMYLAFGDRVAYCFRSNNKKIYVLEDPIMTDNSAWNKEMWIIQPSTVFFAFLKYQKVSLQGGQSSGYGGFLRDITNYNLIDEGSGCPLKIEWEMNGSLIWFCRNLNTRVMFAECGFCDIAPSINPDGSSGSLPAGYFDPGTGEINPIPVGVGQDITPCFAASSLANAIPALTATDNVSVTGFRITALPSSGTLNVGGVPVVLNQLLSVVQAGTLTIDAPATAGTYHFLFSPVDNLNREGNDAVVRYCVA